MGQDKEMLGDSEEPRLYRELASWFHLLTRPEDYAFEADLYGRLLTESAQIPVTTVLELGSGGGNNASHMKAQFQLTLTELSEEMLALSRSINPECEHIQGDMKTLRLGRQFDAVFVHDAVSYMTTEDDLRAAMVTAWAHCKPGGATVLGQDEVRESFRAKTDHEDMTAPTALSTIWNGRGIRTLETRPISLITPTCSGRRTVMFGPSTTVTSAGFFRVLRG
jgi:SAM-dependent methyltransferase